jgi:hypothetical protein
VKVEDADVEGSLMHFDVIQLGLQLLDLVILVEGILLEGLVLRLRCPQ